MGDIAANSPGPAQHLGREDPAPGRGRLREVALLFLRLGFTAFGGPAAHVAMMEDEVVRRRGWLDRRHFLDIVSALNFIPGPNSTELAIHLGYLRAGLPGLVVAGACFILPAVTIILPIAWAYVTYGDVPQVRGMLQLVNAVIVAVLAAALWRLGRAAIRDRFAAAVGVLSVAAAAAFARWPQPGVHPEIVILAAAALAGALWYRRAGANGPDRDIGQSPPAPPPPTSTGSASAALALPATGVLAQAATASPGIWTLGWFFLKIGATLFGSGYVLVNYLQSGLVDRRPAWLSQQELVGAVAVGQVTPGPLLTTATFVGYVIGFRDSGSHAEGVAGALVATAAIFLPAFVLVALLARFLPRLRANRLARGALDGMNAAVAGLILVVTVRLAYGSLADPVAAGAAVIAAAAMLVWNVNSTWLIVLAAAAGFARSHWGGG